MKASVTELPFNSFLGLQKAAEPSQLLRLPPGGQYLNHLGTVHASAQLALAEASSGEFLLHRLASVEDIVDIRFVGEDFFAAFAHWGEIFPKLLEQFPLEIAVTGAAFLKSFAHVGDFVL